MEIEAKFGVPDEETFQRLLAATQLAGCKLGAGSVAQIHDRYFDTRDRSILAGGFACRLRHWDDRYLATLKGLGEASGAIHRRQEYEVELARPLSPQDWPLSDARDLALGLCAGQPLVILFEIRQVRHSRSLIEGDRIVGELCLERVHVGRKDAVTATYLELEAELVPGGLEEELNQIAAELEEAWGLAPESRSKFERAATLFDTELASAMEAEWAMESPWTPQEHAGVGATELAQPSRSVELLERPGIEPDDPMSEAGRKTFRFHFRRMLYNEPGTRQGEDIEFLHDMRVATRRMRAAFRVFGDYFEPKAVAPYLKGLQRTGRALGRVRDLDVFRAKIQAYLDTLPESRHHDLDPLLAVLEKQRGEARERMNLYLDSAKHARFVERFGEFVETEGRGSLTMTLDGDEPRPHRVRHVAPMAIYERLAAVRAYDEWVSIPEPPLERLHALRIACKRLRYTMEFFHEVLGPDTKAPINQVVTLQDHLGDLQDAVVASDILRDFLKWGTWGPRTASEPPLETPVLAAGVEAYLAAKQAELRHLLDTLPEAWQRLNGPEFSRMVAEAIVVL